MEYLVLLCSGKRNISRIYEVCKAFYSAEKQDRCLTMYLMEFKRTYEELIMLLPFSHDVKEQAQREKFLMSLKLLNLILSLVLRFHIYKKHLVGCCAQRILHLLDLIVLLLVEITYLNLEDSNTKVVVKEWRQATMTKILTLEDRNLEVLFVTIVISRGSDDT